MTSTVINNNSGEILDLPHYQRFEYLHEKGYCFSILDYEKHIKIVEQIKEIPYRQPIRKPITTQDVVELTKDIPNWYVLQDNLTLENSLQMGLTTTDQKVYLAILKGIKARNFSTTTVKEISEEWGIPDRSVRRSIQHLKDIRVIEVLSSEVIEIHPYLAWRGDYESREETLKIKVRK